MEVLVALMLEAGQVGYSIQYSEKKTIHLLRSFEICERVVEDACWSVFSRVPVLAQISAAGDMHRIARYAAALLVAKGPVRPRSQTELVDIVQLVILLNTRI